MTSNNPASPQSGDILEAIRSTETFNLFLDAAAAADLLDTLKGAGPFTVFAPTDEAFAKFPPATLSKLMDPDHKPLLRSVISFHFAVGQVAYQRFVGKTINAKSYEGGVLRIQGDDGVVVNGARVVMPDIAAANGVIHGIDRVLWPSPAAEAGV